MQSERQQPWQVSINARTKYFHFEFDAANTLSKWKLSPFPIKIKLKINLRSSLLQAKKSEPFLKKGKYMKPKFLQILGKFRLRPFKSKATTAKQISNLAHPDSHFPVYWPRNFAFEEPMCVSSIVIGFIALLCQSISQKDVKGTIVFGLIMLLYLALIFKKLVARRRRIAFFTLIAAMLTCAIGVYLSNMLKINEGYVSDCVWTSLNYAWNYDSSFAQVIRSSFSQYVLVD